MKTNEILQNRERQKDFELLEYSRKRLQEIAIKYTTCFFCSGTETKNYFLATPMRIQKVDEDGKFWFISAVDSKLNKEIELNPQVQLLFQGIQDSDFLCVNGIAIITTEKDLIIDLWDQIYKKWFKNGVKDPRITVVCVDAQEVFYWDTLHGQVI